MALPSCYSDAMKRLSVRLSDEVHAALTAELPEWQKLRGPRFSLNELCSQKLSTPFPPTQWVASNWDVVTTGTSSPLNSVYTVTCSVPSHPSENPKKVVDKRRNDDRRKK